VEAGMKAVRTLIVVSAGLFLLLILLYEAGRMEADLWQVLTFATAITGLTFLAGWYVNRPR
jgi:hypothetical protein